MDLNTLLEKQQEGTLTAEEKGKLEVLLAQEMQAIALEQARIASQKEAEARRVAFDYDPEYHQTFGGVLEELQTVKNLALKEFKIHAHARLSKVFREIEGDSMIVRMNEQQKFFQTIIIKYKRMNFSYKSVDVDGNLREREISFVDLVKEFKGELSLKIDGTTSYPRRRGDPCIMLVNGQKLLNISPCMAATYRPVEYRTQNGKALIQPLLDHLKYCMCEDSDYNTGLVLACLYCCMVLFIKSKLMPIFYSKEHQIGKSFFFNVITRYVFGSIGEALSAVVAGFGPLTSNENAILEHKLCIVCNEGVDAEGNNNLTALIQLMKTKVTEDTHGQKKLYKNKENVISRFSAFLCLNEFGAIVIEKDDQRYPVFEAKKPWGRINPNETKEEYFAKLYDFLPMDWETNPASRNHAQFLGDMFYTYMIDEYLSEKWAIDPRKGPLGLKIPMTKLRLIAMERNLPPILQFLEEVKTGQKVFVRTNFKQTKSGGIWYLSGREFYDICVLWMDDNGYKNYKITKSKFLSIVDQDNFFEICHERPVFVDGKQLGPGCKGYYIRGVNAQKIIVSDGVNQFGTLEPIPPPVVVPVDISQTPAGSSSD